MPAPIYVVDAFSSQPFRGNPAGVCLLDSPAEDQWMQRVAAEMNHAETAFLVPLGNNRFGLRWFTPAVEVDLCGHATLASAKVLWSAGRAANAVIEFDTRSGLLTAAPVGTAIEIDFPSEKPSEDPLPIDLGFPTLWQGRNRMDRFVQVQSDSWLRSYEPAFALIESLGDRGLIVTAESSSPEQDFVSRCFFPQSGVPEDSVTGSAHCALAPFWAERLGRSELRGYQASARGGHVGVQVMGDRVKLRGEAVIVLEGTLHC